MLMITIEQKIGLDATTLSNLEIVSVDENKLFADFYRSEKNNVKKIGSAIMYNEEKTSVPSFKIIDNLFFGHLVFKSYSIRNNHYRKEKIYSEITINAGHILSDNRNNVLLRTFKDYIRYVLKPYLCNRYGLELDFLNVKFRNLEINITLPIANVFSNYQRVLSLLESNLSGRGYFSTTKNRDTKCFNVSNQFGKINKSEEFVFYNKAKTIRDNYRTELKCKKIKEKILLQMQMADDSSYKELKSKELEHFEHFLFCEEAIRFELRLFNFGKTKRRSSSNQKIEKFLGITNPLLRNINDEILSTAFIKYLEKILLQPFVRWYQQNKKDMRQIVIEYKQEYGSQWQNYFYPAIFKKEIFDGRAAVLDFIHLKDILNFNSKKNNIYLKHNLATIMKSFEKKEAKNGMWDLLKKQDSQKIIEIFEGMGLDYRTIFQNKDIHLIP